MLHKQPADKLGFARSLVAAADNLDLFGLDLGLVLQLEFDIFDQERPHLITEAICVQVALETQARLHFLRQNVCDASVEVSDDFHCQLRLDPPFTDQLVQRIDQRHADTATAIELIVLWPTHIGGRLSEIAVATG